MAYELGLTSSMTAASTLFGFDPASVYYPGGERIMTHAGSVVYTGFARSMWKFGWIDVTAYNTLINTTLAFTAGTYSKAVYVKTRNEYDTEATYTAIMRLPDPAELERWGEKYLNVEIEFVLTAVVT